MTCTKESAQCKGLMLLFAQVFTLSLSLALAHALCLTTLSFRLTSTQSVTIEQTEHVYPN